VGPAPLVSGVRQNDSSKSNYTSDTTIPDAIAQLKMQYSSLSHFPIWNSSEFF
jgi:hypothetical protein